MNITKPPRPKEVLYATNISDINITKIEEVIEGGIKPNEIRNYLKNIIKCPVYCPIISPISSDYGFLSEKKEEDEISLNEILMSKHSRVNIHREDIIENYIKIKDNSNGDQGKEFNCPLIYYNKKRICKIDDSEKTICINAIIPKCKLSDFLITGIGIRELNSHINYLELLETDWDNPEKLVKLFLTPEYSDINKCLFNGFNGHDIPIHDKISGKRISIEKELYGNKMSKGLLEYYLKLMEDIKENINEFLKKLK